VNVRALRQSTFGAYLAVPTIKATAQLTNVDVLHMLQLAPLLCHPASYVVALKVEHEHAAVMQRFECLEQLRVLQADVDVVHR
jgi:hypothetical protein